jgi:hypothetical protein
LTDFREGRLRVLCACDLLNEGWDCPDIEVLLMARPTLSKVIYLQQLGRGTRKAPGKECLVVFDFVDNATRYNQSLSLHRVLGAPQYRPGGLVLAPADAMTAEQAALAHGQRPTAVVNINLWAKEYEVIDVFNWQEAMAGMISVSEAELELAASEGRLRRAVERGDVQADETLTLGERTYHYFKRERLEEIRLALGLPRVDDQSIRDLFIQFVEAMDMAASYKPVMLLALLGIVDQHGRARLDEVVSRFRQFYVDRQSAGLMVERASTRMARVSSLGVADVQQVLLQMPFEKFERKKYLRYDRDLAYVRFEPALWHQLKPADLEAIRKICHESIAQYYERLNQG